MRDAETSTRIATVHRDNYGVYGARKVHAELNRAGHPVARCTVERLMRILGLRAVLISGPRPRESDHENDCGFGQHTGCHLPAFDEPADGTCRS